MKMSTTSRSKSKAAAAAASNGAKEQLKVSSWPSTLSISSGNTSIAPSSSSLSQNDYRLLSVDDADDNFGSSYGSTSNNGSCSGEAEDHKEKTATSPPRHSEPVPGSDNDKRDKMRQKNERKHQRQRERRAQELHERCTSFLMSRKLEVLSQKLVAMGFSSERARLALLVNEGRVEDSVAWLFEEDDGSRQELAEADVDGGSMKIDIANELARIAELETMFKCTQQEVERAVVACEGDLNKAAEILEAQKQQITEKVLEAGDTAGNDTTINQTCVAAGVAIGKTQLKGTALPASIKMQLMNAGGNSRVVVGVPPQPIMTERTLQGLQSLSIQQSGPEWTMSNDLLPSGKRRVSASSSLPVSYSTPPLQVPGFPMRPEAQFTIGAPETRVSSQPGMPREPVILMQRPQSVSIKQNHTSMGMNGFASASPPASSKGWYPNGMSDIDVVRNMKGLMGRNAPGLAYSGSRPQFQNNRYQPYVTTGLTESNGVGRVGLGSGIMMPTSSSSLSAPSSLGLFSNPGNGRSSEALSAIDWSTGGSLSHVDYSSIDWSLNSIPLRKERIPESWPPTSMGVDAARPSVDSRGTNMLDSASSSGYEWTSPFEEKDLFRDPRQFVANYKMK